MLAASARPGIVDITAANYLELLAANVVRGSDATHAFLRDCCLGGWMADDTDTESTDAGWLRP